MTYEETITLYKSEHLNYKFTYAIGLLSIFFCSHLLPPFSFRFVFFSYSIICKEYLSLFYLTLDLSLISYIQTSHPLSILLHVANFSPLPIISSSLAHSHFHSSSYITSQPLNKSHICVNMYITILILFQMLYFSFNLIDQVDRLYHLFCMSFKMAQYHKQFACFCVHSGCMYLDLYVLLLTWIKFDKKKRTQGKWSCEKRGKEFGERRKQRFE